MVKIYAESLYYAPLPDKVIDLCKRKVKLIN